MAEKKKVLKGLGQAITKGAVNVAPYALAASLYTKIFYHRIITDPIKLYSVDNFPNLQAERVTFKNKANDDLVGYFYHCGDFKKDKIIVFAHGYGNGHKRYLEIINALCEKGFLVFGYDATSFDESGGEGIRSFPQAIIDLYFAVKYVKEQSPYKDYDLYIMGHSMGGYAAGCNLYLLGDTVKKAILVSAFNKSIDLIKLHGREWVGEEADKCEPYIGSYESLFFNEIADLSVVDGLKKEAKTKVLIIHSKDDTTVPYEGSCSLYKEATKGKNRIKFIDFEHNGHGTVFYSEEGRRYFKESKEKYEKYCKSQPNLEISDKTSFIANNIDTKKWTNLLDHNLIDRIAEFLNEK